MQQVGQKILKNMLDFTANEVRYEAARLFFDLLLIRGGVWTTGNNGEVELVTASDNLIERVILNDHRGRKHIICPLQVRVR